MLNLISIRINGASTVIPDDAAAIANGAVIYGMADSTAKAYAEKFGRKFIEISHDHVYTETWTSNTESHWHACTICGDKKGTADHAYKDNCDTVCNICDYVREIVHDYADTWSHDNDNHWHECTVCGDKNNLVKHSYDNDCDTTCNICDYIRSTEHDYKTEWTLDGSSHWHACTICGDKKGVVAHTPGEAVISNKIEPTCTVEGSYDEVVSCRICGGLISNKTIMIDAPGHDFSDEYKYDISGHYRECGICSGKSATELHTFVDDTCICGYYEASSGVIGGITWSFDRESGVLVIGGEGAITGTDLPWGVFVDRIVKVELGGGITSINADIFEGCDNVIFVIININIVIGGSLGKTPTIIAPAGSPVYSYAKSSGINFIPSSGTGFCGSDGDNLYWSIENGKLTISGSGNMADFSGVSAPWADRIGQIKQIELGDGVTSIGGGAFAGCKNVIIIITNVNLIILGDGDTISSGATIILPVGSAARDYADKYAERTFIYGLGGYCGADGGRNVIWNFDETTGKLSFIGVGEIDSVSIPWADKIGQIREIYIPRTITGFNADIFAGCTNVVIVIMNVNIIIIGNASGFGDGVTIRSFGDSSGKRFADDNALPFDEIKFIYGDANGDHVIDSKDIIMIKKYIANYDNQTVTSTVEVDSGADVNGDGKIDSKDVILLKKYIENLDSSGNSTIILGKGRG